MWLVAIWHSYLPLCLSFFFSFLKEGGGGSQCIISLIGFWLFTQKLVLTNPTEWSTIPSSLSPVCCFVFKTRAILKGLTLRKCVFQFCLIFVHDRFVYISLEKRFTYRKFDLMAEFDRSEVTVRVRHDVTIRLAG